MGAANSSANNPRKQRAPAFAKNLTPVLIDSDTHTVRSSRVGTGLEFVLVKSAVEETKVKRWGSGIRSKGVIPARFFHDRAAKADRALVEKNLLELVHTHKHKMGHRIAFFDLHMGVVLGAGTYGEVCSATFKGQPVAVKKLFSGSTPVETEEVFTDFKREIKILQRIKHDRITTFIGWVEESHCPFCLVFERLEGNVSTLLRAVRKNEVAITYRICLGIVKDAAQAMGYLHRRTPPILHRDLKAENLLLESNFRCKLTDFGLSRTFSSDKPSKMTVCGTPSWVAPEVFRGEEYCEKVDVYSFGILLWEIFAGKKPYGDKSSADLPYLVGSTGLRPDRLTHVPEVLWGLMEACWKETPEARPAFGRIEERLARVTEIVADADMMSAPVHGMNLKRPFPRTKLGAKIPSPLSSWEERVAIV